MSGDVNLCNRLLAFARVMSSHSFFDPIFCLLLTPFLFEYMRERNCIRSNQRSPLPVEGIQSLLMTCMTSVYKGSNRLFMFDVNGCDDRFDRFYEMIYRGVVQSCQEDSNPYNERDSNEFNSIKQQTKEATSSHPYSPQTETVIVASSLLPINREKNLSCSSEPTVASSIQTTRSPSPTSWRLSNQQEDQLFDSFVRDILSIIGKYLFYYNEK